MQIIQRVKEDAHTINIPDDWKAFNIKWLADHYGISYQSLYKKLSRGIALTEAITLTIAYEKRKRLRNGS